MSAGRKKSDMPVVLILAGGKGERFWPRSREKTPKQLQKVYSSKTLLEETLVRAKIITHISRIYIGCNASLKKSILASHKGLTDQNFIIEPEGKNTAPIVALAALQLEKKHPGAIHVILSADHYISSLDEFKKTIDKAESAAREGFLVTLGVRPSRPEIGYGYIESEGESPSVTYQRISSFREKPGISVAMEYLESGRHYWNSGIFVWTGKSILEEFDLHANYIIDPRRSALSRGPSALKAAFNELKSDPVDIAILEKSKKIVMVPASFTWDDVGSWLSLERICSADDRGNVFVKGSDISSLLAKKSSGNIVSSSFGLVALLGVKDLIIVEDRDVLFISSRERSGEIKELIADMRKNPALQKYLL
jgi:mannose-1-phosphate guanylyltransferase